MGLVQLLTQNMTSKEAENLTNFGLSIGAAVTAFTAARNAEEIKTYLKRTLQQFRDVYGATELPLIFEHATNLLENEQITYHTSRRNEFKNHYQRPPTHTTIPQLPHGRYNY